MDRLFWLKGSFYRPQYFHNISFLQSYNPCRNKKSIIFSSKSRMEQFFLRSWWKRANSGLFNDIIFIAKSSSSKTRLPGCHLNCSFGLYASPSKDNPWKKENCSEQVRIIPGRKKGSTARSRTSWLSPCPVHMWKESNKSSEIEKTVRKKYQHDPISLAISMKIIHLENNSWYSFWIQA